MATSNFVNILKGLAFSPFFILISYSASQNGLLSSLLQLFSFVVILLPFALFGLTAFTANAVAVVTYLILLSGFKFSDTLSLVNIAVYLALICSVPIMHNFKKQRLNIAFLTPIVISLLLGFGFLVLCFTNQQGQTIANQFNVFLQSEINQQALNAMLTTSSGELNNISVSSIINMIVMFLPSMVVSFIAIGFTISYYITFSIANQINSKISKEKYKADNKANVLHNTCFLIFAVLALLINNIFNFESPEAGVSNIKYFVYTATLAYLIAYAVVGVVTAFYIVKTNIIYLLILVIVALFLHVSMLFAAIILGILQSFRIISISYTN